MLSLPYLGVEQVEVIRRLRNSGATVQQIAEAYDVFDKLDKELGSFGLIHANGQQVSHASPNNAPPQSAYIAKKSIEGANACRAKYISLLSFQSGNGDGNLPNSNNQVTNSQLNGLDTPAQGHNKKRVKILPECALKEASWCFLFSIARDAIVEMISKCTHTIQNFDPWVLTNLYGVDPNDVNTFLSGDLAGIESDNQVVVVDWFIKELHKAEWFIEEVTEYSDNVMSQDNYETQFTPRRERFVYRDVHLSVLESNFKRNQYPSPSLRKKIANECNIKMAMASGQALGEKERVSMVNVDHWFRNKRKDMIRKAKLSERSATKEAVSESQGQTSLPPITYQQMISSASNVSNSHLGIQPVIPQNSSNGLSMPSQAWGHPQEFPLRKLETSSTVSSFQPATSRNLTQSNFSEFIHAIGTNARPGDTSLNNITNSITVKEEPLADEYNNMQSVASYGTRPSPSEPEKLCVAFNFQQEKAVKS